MFRDQQKKQHQLPIKQKGLCQAQLPTICLAARASPLGCAPMIKPSARPITGCSVGTKNLKTNSNRISRQAQKFRHRKNQLRQVLVNVFFRCTNVWNKPAAASREGAGFRLALTVSRCPKPRRGEAVAPAPVGVPAGQGVSRRRSANPAVSRRVTWGSFLPPLGA